MPGFHLSSWEGVRVLGGVDEVSELERILFLGARTVALKHCGNSSTCGVTLWLLTEQQPFLVRICWLPTSLRASETPRGRNHTQEGS